MSILTPTTEWPQSLTILDLADMIRREGTGLYTDGGIPGCVYQASLCGLTASYARGGSIVMLKGLNLHLVIDLQEKPVEENADVVFNSDSRVDVITTYVEGDAATLDAWHRHLCAYRRSMRPTGTTVAA